MTNIPMVRYSPLMVVAYGADAKEDALNGRVVCATKLEEIATKI